MLTNIGKKIFFALVIGAPGIFISAFTAEGVFYLSSSVFLKITSFIVLLSVFIVLYFVAITKDSK